jgi:hypothetical protein
MDTDALIEALARDAAPVPRRSFERRLGAALMLGTITALVLLVVGLGLRPDLLAAAGTSGFWGKAAYTSSLALIGLLLLARLARPETQRLPWAWLIAAPVFLLAVFASTELGAAPHSARSELLFDPLWTCVPLILGLAVPSDLTVDAEVDLGTNENGYQLAARLNVSLPGVSPDDARRLVEAAHNTCPYSKATRGNVPVELNLI